MVSFFTEGSKYERYGPLNTHDLLKLIALAGMTADHVGAYLMPDCLWLRAIGRVATPAWFFLAGFSKPSRPFAFELVFLALVMAVIHALTEMSVFPLNALVSVIACRACAHWIEPRGWIRTQPIVLWGMGFIWALPTMILFEYGTLAVLYAMMGVICREKMDTPAHRAFCVLTVASFIGYQLIEYDFNAAQAVFVTAVTAVISYIGLYRFELKAVRLPLFENPVKLVARYSLYYYAIHRAAMQVAAMLLYPSAHGAFYWISH